MMTFRELTELQEKLRNAAHTSTMTLRVETNGWNQLDYTRRWIAARDGLQPEMARGRRWMTGDGSPEMDHGRQMAINPLPFYEDIEVMRSHTILEITTLISSYEVPIERRYADT